MIGAKIREARQAAGLTQRELGAAIGKGISTVSEWEKDLRSPDVELIPAIAAACGVSIADLLDVDVHPKGEAVTEEERRLLSAFRAADPVYRAVALELLLSHPRA